MLFFWLSIYTLAETALFELFPLLELALFRVLFIFFLFFRRENVTYDGCRCSVFVFGLFAGEPGVLCLNC